MRRARIRCGAHGRRDEPHRLAVDRERSGLVLEPALEPGLAAQHDAVAVERDDVAEEARRPVQDPQARPRLLRAERGLEPRRPVDGTGEDAATDRRGT